MAKPNFIELTSKRDRFYVLYEDRSILAIDKPAGWMLVPVSWQKTDRNLQAAMLSSIGAGDFWARSRNLKYARYIHRLDAETTGILLFAKSIGALRSYEELFETRKMEKVYLAVTDQKPQQETWNCKLSIAPDPRQFGRMIADEATGKSAETDFRLLSSVNGKYLVEARPYSGRTHQIRIHMAQTGCPIVGDQMYGHGGKEKMGLRAAGLAFKDPFTRKPIAIRAPLEEFLGAYGFDAGSYRLLFHSLPAREPKA